MRAVVRVTLDCDNRCVFCAQRGLEARDEAPLAERLAAARAEHDELMLVGGEPLLADTNAIATARALGFTRIGLQTNGRKFGEKGLAARLAEEGLTDVHFSLHGAEPAVHDYHVGVPGAFAQLLHGLAAARGAGLTIAVTTLLTRSNYRSLEALPRLLRQTGVDAWNIALPRTAGAAGEAFDRVMPRLTLALPFALHALESARRVGLHAFIEGAPSCLLGPFAQRALVTESRTHHSKCEGCPSRAHCPGLDERYLQRFGGDEIGARASAPPGVDVACLRRLFVGSGELAPAMTEGAEKTVKLVSLGT